LRPDNAEALAGWRFHYDPPPDIGDAFCAQLFQSRRFGLQVVCLDVYMDAAFVIYFLNLDMHVFGPGFQSDVFRFSRVFPVFHLEPKRLAPELSREFQVLGSAVQNKTGQLTFMHDEPSLLQSWKEIPKAI
jgi:hypothetical protein